MNNEKRRHIRANVEENVEISVQVNKNSIGRVTDISEAGLFVESLSHVDDGDFIVIEFLGEIIMFGATVRRVTDNGFGAEFGSMKNEHREVLSRFLPKLETAEISSVMQMPIVMLLVDNGSHSILEKELEKAGFAVLKVTSIDKAIASLNRFEVAGLISDYVVGGKDTLPILKKIKEQQEKQNLSVIMYSDLCNIPNNNFEGLGIICFARSNMPPQNLVSNIKDSFARTSK